MPVIRAFLLIVFTSTQLGTVLYFAPEATDERRRLGCRRPIEHFSQPASAAIETVAAFYHSGLRTGCKFARPVWRKQISRSSNFLFSIDCRAIFTGNLRDLAMSS